MDFGYSSYHAVSYLLIVQSRFILTGVIQLLKPQPVGLPSAPVCISIERPPPRPVILVMQGKSQTTMLIPVTVEGRHLLQRNFFQ